MRKKRRVFKVNYKIVLLILLLIFFGVVIFRVFVMKADAATQVACPVNGRFNIVKAVICDPEGKPFLPSGSNTFAGPSPNGFPTDILNPQVMMRLTDWWKTNAFIIAICPTGHCSVHENAGGTTVAGPDLDAVIQAYTAKKIVMILSDFDIYGSLDSLPQDHMTFIQNWHKTMAEKYKNNPYVWFEPYNEGMGGHSLDKWTALNEPVVQAIRGTGNMNPIVLNAVDYGQDRLSVGGPINPAESTILTHGVTLANKYPNIMFDVHIYSRWAGTSAADLKAYFALLHERGVAVYVGQTSGAPVGSACHWEFADEDFIATQRLYEARPNGVGIFPWSTGGCYVHVAGTSFDQINDQNNPTNLAVNGPLHWAWTHNLPAALPDGYTVEPGACPKKPQGDADCNGAISITDYAVWRLEFRGGCSPTMLTAAACGDDKDKNGSLMDSDFNGDSQVKLVDFQLWRNNIR